MNLTETVLANLHMEDASTAILLAAIGKTCWNADISKLPDRSGRYPFSKITGFSTNTTLENSSSLFGRSCFGTRSIWKKSTERGSGTSLSMPHKNPRMFKVLGHGNGRERTEENEQREKEEER